MILKHIWQIIIRVTIIVAVLLTFLVLIELLRTFELFYSIKPLFGWIFLAILVLLISTFMIYFLGKWLAYPRPLIPPPLPEDLSTANQTELKKCKKYYCRYLTRLSKNPTFEASEIDQAKKAIATLNATSGNHEKLTAVLTAAEQDTLVPLLDKLQAKADQEVRRSVRDVMLGVTLSPYHSIDLLVVLYRNCIMVLRVARIFASRPTPREEIKILGDVLKIVATVNVLHLGRSLFENLFANLPLVGRTVDDIAQGLGAGLLTSAAGHAAIARCAAFRGWNSDAAKAKLTTQVGQFFSDVRDSFAKDVLPSLKGRIVATTPAEKVEQPGFWDNVTNGITGAVDLTAQGVNNLLVKPAMAGTKGVFDAGFFVTKGAAQASLNAGRGLGRLLSAPWKTNHKKTE